MTLAKAARLAGSGCGYGSADRGDCSRAVVLLGGGVAVGARLLARRRAAGARSRASAAPTPARSAPRSPGGAEHDHARRPPRASCGRPSRRTRWSRICRSAPSSRTGCGSAWSSSCRSARWSPAGRRSRSAGDGTLLRDVPAGLAPGDPAGGRSRAARRVTDPGCAERARAARGHARAARWSQISEVTTSTAATAWSSQLRSGPSIYFGDAPTLAARSGRRRPRCWPTPSSAGRDATSTSPTRRARPPASARRRVAAAGLATTRLADKRRRRAGAQTAGSTATEPTDRLNRWRPNPQVEL